MPHRSITLQSIGFTLPHRVCFHNFSTQIQSGKRIAIIGKNGAGKTTLLKIIQGLIEPSEGHATVPSDIIFGFVPQIIESHSNKSGGQRFQQALTDALALDPNILCLDEPTNHLDQQNKQSLLRKLANFAETLIVVSHDPELLRLSFDELWHIDDEVAITIFRGSYDEYLKMIKLEQHKRLAEIEQLSKEKIKTRSDIQREQKRASQSRKSHSDEPDRNLLRKYQETGSATAGKLKGRLSKRMEQINTKLASTRMSEQITPKFRLVSRTGASSKPIVAITDGMFGYDAPVVDDINMQLYTGERIALQGANGSGKSTFFKALLHDPHVMRSGEWMTPDTKDVGYLDQHYHSLSLTQNAFELIKKTVPTWSDNQIRDHLNAFLFRKNEEVFAPIEMLSGGEKCRLSLAQIGAQNPIFLLLDEITNNVDAQTREHIIAVLNAYRGTLIVISHDNEFLEQIVIADYYQISNNRLISHFYNRFITDMP